MTRDPDLGALASHLAERAGTYYRDLAGHRVEVRHLHSEARPYALIHRFSLHAGARVHRVLVKEPRLIDLRHLENVALGRPRLFPRAEPHVRYAAEYESLKVIESRLAGPERGFCFIRALDFIEARSAIVMELSSGKSLRNLLAHHTVLHRHRHPSDLEGAFVAAGAWLRAYHELDLPASLEARTTRGQVVSFAASVSEYLARTTPDGSFIRHGCDTLIKALERTLPEQLPVATAHADFAPRNILIEKGDCIAVIDTASRWLVCRLEDVAHFLLSLRLSRAQAVCQLRLYSASAMSYWEETFLRAYLREDVDPPVRAVFAYQLVLLLDMWSARLAASRRRRLGAAEAFLLRRSYRSEAERLISLIA